MILVEQKKRLRKQVLLKLKEQSLKERMIKSSAIAEKLFKSRAYLDAKSIMFYAAMIYEVDTEKMILDAFQRGKRVFLPLMKKEKKEIIPCEIKDLEKDTHLCEYGFLEPNIVLKGNADVKEIDLVIIPGIAFDINNNRMGRGGGYYDKFLSYLDLNQKKKAVAFDFQVFNEIPTEGHDFRLDEVITNG